MGMIEKKRLPLSFKNNYQNLSPYLKQAKEELVEIIEEHLRRIGKRFLARVRLVEARIKDFDSVREKIIRKNISVIEFIEKIEDLVGMRIVCKNIEDAYRIKDILLTDKRLLPKRDAQDQIERPSSSGYRALHLNIEYALKPSQNSKPIVIPCEIQIRTMLQDSWASLAHDDIYKEGSYLPNEVKKLSRRLSDLLAVADGIAQDIRDRISSPAVVSLADKKGEKGEVNRFRLNFIFHQAFNEDIPEYLVTVAMTLCDKIGLFRLDGLQDILSDKKFISQLKEEYKNLFPVDISNEDIFLLAITAAGKGTEIAVKEGIKQFRKQYQEIDAIAQREECFLPETVKELIGELSLQTKEAMFNQDFYIEQLARRFGAIGECLLCGTDIVKVDTLVEEILDYYSCDNDEDAERLTDIISNSGVEQGGFHDSSLCNYHEDQASRD